MPPLAEITQLIVFGVLATAVVVGALGVVMLPNIVYSAFLLGGVFLSVAGLYLMLNASFIAAAQILIYVGAVNVLILFAIMLVNKSAASGDLPSTASATTSRPGMTSGAWPMPTAISSMARLSMSWCLVSSSAKRSRNLKRFSSPNASRRA